MLFRKKNLVKLDEVFKYLSNIPAINRGGCAIAALAIKRWMQKNNLDCDIVYVYAKDYKSWYRRNKLYIKNGEGKPTSCNHAVIKFKGKLYDVNGRYKVREKYEQPVTSIMAEKIVVSSINEPMWNYDFDRKYVSNIEKRLQIDLSDILIF